MDLTEAADIKKRWQEYTEQLYKKDLHNPDNHDGVITHLEPDTPGKSGLHARGEGQRVMALESREGTRASRRV